MKGRVLLWAGYSVWWSFYLLVAIMFLPGGAEADTTRAVRPVDRLQGQWLADMDSMRDYLSSILEPVSGQCVSVRGTVIYSFNLSGDPRTHVMTCVVEGNSVAIKRTRAGGSRSDTITFVYDADYSSPVTVNAADRIIETSATPDFSSVTVQGFTVNGNFVGEMDLNSAGLSRAFGANRMRYELLGDSTLRLTPIFPPAPDGVPIHPRPLTLHRTSHDPAR